MRIYFEDGELLEEKCIRFELSKVLINNELYLIDAGKGPTTCMQIADALKRQNNKNISIYTNSLELFTNSYAWNDELKAPEIYVRHAQTHEFIRLDELTERELREAHNLRRLYIGGEFAAKQGLPW